MFATTLVAVVAAAILGAPAQMQEDDPGWDCATMGNHICGPVNDAGAPAHLELTQLWPGVNSVDDLHAPVDHTGNGYGGNEHYTCATDLDCGRYAVDHGELDKVPYGWEPGQSVQAANGTSYIVVEYPNGELGFEPESAN